MTFCNCAKLLLGQEGVESIYEQCFSSLIGRRSILASYWSNFASVADCALQPFTVCKGFYFGQILFILGHFLKSEYDVSQLKYKIKEERGEIYAFQGY